MQFNMNVHYAQTFWARAQGMLFGAGSAPGECLVLVPCSDIHTFGMRYNIDVAFVDESGSVLLARRALAPCRRFRCKGAYAAIERRSSNEPWLEVGQRFPLKAIDNNTQATVCL